MKKCPNCHAEVNENFDICWNCQYSFIEFKVLADTDFKTFCPKCNAELDASISICPICKTDLNSPQIEELSQNTDSVKEIECLRCKVQMTFKDTYYFHEGSSILTPNILFDTNSSRVKMDMYVCPNCGKIEFFDPGF